ncbi:PIR Superfamily Protein [Plasmodium ovale curtisi]|uniref:PIR Superfamily Protein n=1 Tax=Plasmodium ovale curtisi TaxID=864141 RepID=A0A1A8WMR2_PLAOA|nr:PIR Superfamily Protein [Plasmodium ovale curtisi]SBT00990.1 PIR Superfamily Protein [Plasmodium ovale curtisi]
MATDDYYLNILPSYIFYDQLDTANNDNYISDQSAYWNTFIKQQSIRNISTFDTLVKGLYYASHLNKKHTFYDERWNYLYFWTGLKVLDSNDASSFSDVMTVLKSVRDHTDKNEEYDELIKISKEHFRELKKIYDYLQNYETIEFRISPDNSECSLMYKEYVESSYSAYNDIKSKCQRNYIDHYCKIFNRFEQKYKKNIKNLTCTGNQIPKKELEISDFEDSEGDISPHRQYAQASHLSSDPEGVTRDMAIGTGDVSPSSGSTNAISTVFPVLGSASLLFIFLKFTPLGSRLHNTIFSKRIIRNNEEEDAQEILDNSYEFAHTNMEENAHHIAYHSM